MTRVSLGIAVLVVSAVACASAEEPDTDCEVGASPVDRIRLQSTLFRGLVESWDGTTAVVLVTEVWRGPDLADRVDVRPEAGRRFTVGADYLFFPENNSPPFVDRRCSATARWNDTFGDLRPANYRSFARPRSVPVGWLALAALAAIIAASWIAAGRRSRMPESVWNPGHRIADEEDPR